MPHPIKPETRKAFEEQFKKYLYLCRDASDLRKGEWKTTDDLLQFIAEREHAAEERGYVAGYKDGSATDGKNAAKIWKKRVQALTNKESE